MVATPACLDFTSASNESISDRLKTKIYNQIKTLESNTGRHFQTTFKPLNPFVDAIGDAFAAVGVAGSGGGGGRDNTNGALGGSGLVIIRYAI